MPRDRWQGCGRDPAPARPASCKAESMVILLLFEMIPSTKPASEAPRPPPLTALRPRSQTSRDTR